MKLLREFFRLRAAGMRTVLRRGAAASPVLHVTVPAPLQRVADEAAVVVELPRAANSGPMTARREPASFLKAPRHRRLGSGRG
jgi:hypothetical protein